MTEIPDRESTLSRDLAGVNCALVKIVDAEDRYYVLVGEPELYRDGFRLETTDVLTLSRQRTGAARKSPPKPMQRPAAEQTRPGSE